MTTSPTVKITAIINRDALGKVGQALKDAGVSDIYVAVGRAPTLEEGGLLNVFRSRMQLSSRPVEVVNCFVREDQEPGVLKLIADAAQLTIPGMGSVYSEDVNLVGAHPLYRRDDLRLPDAAQLRLSTELLGVYCVVQRGEGDTIARSILENGAATPVITYGRGVGIRDKLGLLRITIPPEKEVINLVATPWNAAELLEEMIERGQLDRPGRGFINTYPVRCGLVDTKTMSGSATGAASVDQMISAIDQLTGNLDWRRTEFQGGQTRHFFSGMGLNILCDHGTGTGLVRAAMEAGCGGATIETFALHGRTRPQKDDLSRAREFCKMMVPADQLDAIIAVLEKSGAYEDQAKGVLFNTEVPRAFTYIARGA